MSQFLSDCNQVNETMFIERKIKKTFLRITNRNEIRLTPVHQVTPVHYIQYTEMLRLLAIYLPLFKWKCVRVERNFLNKFIWTPTKMDNFPFASQKRTPNDDREIYILMLWYGCLVLTKNHSMANRLELLWFV